MPNFSVSAPRELIKIIESNAISPSKAFQIGLEVIKMGGLDKYNEIKNSRSDYEKNLVYKDVKIEELEKRIGHLQEELSIARQKYVEAQKGLEVCEAGFKKASKIEDQFKGD